MGSMIGATFCTLTHRSSIPLEAPSESVTSRRILCRPASSQTISNSEVRPSNTRTSEGWASSGHHVWVKSSMSSTESWAWPLTVTI